MNKKLLPIIAIASTGLLLVGGIGYYLYSRDIISFPSVNRKAVIVPKTPREEVGKFIIIPTKYQLSDAEKQLFIEQKYATIFINNGTEADITYLSHLIDPLVSYKPQYHLLSEQTDYRKCNITTMADVNFTASKSQISRFDLSKQSCEEDNIISQVVDFSCKESLENCHKDFFNYLRGDAIYFYYEKSPFTQRAPNPSILTEQKAGTVILTWESPALPYQLTQRAYSLEYLDKDGKRIIAYGLTEANNQGDYFLPPRDLKGEVVTAKLRVWYSFMGNALPAPEIYTTQFTYQQVQTPPIPADAKNPVEQSWIPDWGMEDGVASVARNPKKWETISPVWYIPNNDGSLIYRGTVNDGRLTTLLGNNGIKLVPTIALFDADVLKNILRNHMQRHIDEIVYVATKYNYYGIDLDYESTYLDDKELLLQFVTELSNRLHEKGKILVFTAMPKIDDRKIYSFLPQTHQAQDWKAIGAVVDEFRIMAYDYTGQMSRQPGPLSPIAWDETLIQYAIANMPAEKVVLGLPLYSHAWPKPTSADLVGPNNDQSLYSGLDKNTVSWQHDDISYVKTHSAYYNETYNPWYAEWRATLKYKNVEREMYYLDKTAIQKRLELAKAYQIKGLCYWRIGGDQL